MTRTIRAGRRVAVIGPVACPVTCLPARRSLERLVAVFVWGRASERLRQRWWSHCQRASLRTSALGLGFGLSLGLGLGCSTPASPPASPPAPVAVAATATATATKTKTKTKTKTPIGERSEVGAATTRSVQPMPSAPESSSTAETAGLAEESGDAKPELEADAEAEAQAQAADSADPLGALLTRTPRCTDPSKDCFGVHLHIVTGDDGVPVQELEWVSAQLAGAQDRFMSSVDASFEVIAVDPLASDKRDIVSRLDRDRLGRPHFSRGVVHVFIVGSLADVDNPGAIRGVHRRDRSNTARRWVILSSIAGSMTLTHELGHFFSLPHSAYTGSLMNKRPDGPPFAERGFHPREAARMRRAKAAMLADGMLKPRTVGGSEP